MSSSEIEGIAIIGMAGRFPKAKDLDEFWQNLRDGVEAISQLTDEDVISTGIEPSVINDPKHIKAGAILEDIDLFDAAFFGFNPKEAAITDPQHRLFLECAWSALENAGYNSENYPGQIGVYAGTGWNSYLLFNLTQNRGFLGTAIDYQTLIGNEKDNLATRVAYKLNLKGPSIGVQTNCSTSLVAIYLACQSLLNYQCDMALAGGVSVNVLQKAGYIYQEGGVLSPTGQCRAFDAKSQGTVGGSGLGVVVLKRLEDAIADRDCIHAVIKSVAVNNDGAAKVGYTAPSIEGQAKVIAETLALGDINPETVTYIETHGTGTALGDPIEIKALTKAFRANTQKQGFCAIGSVKTNIGHLDAAAGIASLIKTVLALKHKQIPPSLHFEQPNPEIDFANSPFYVNNKLSTWERNGTPRRAGVSSFGIGGTNAHVILEEAPVLGEQKSSTSLRDATRTTALSDRGAEEQGKKYQLLVLSAKTESALVTAAANLADHLKQNPDINLADVAYTLQVGRRTFNYRQAVVCRDVEDAIAALQNPQRVKSSFQEAQEHPVAFMFPGLGTHYVDMAGELYEGELVFRQQVDNCCELLKPILGLDLRDVLYPQSSKKSAVGTTGLDLRKMLGRDVEPADAATQQLNQTFLTQPAVFVIEYAVAQLWMSWGIRPMAMIGYSLGEYVAATLAGVLSLEDALTLVAKRAQMIQELPSGAMLAVPLTEKEVYPLLGEQLSLSAVNGNSLCVVAGPIEAVEELEQKLTKQGVACRRLVTSHAFHSTMMEAITPTLRDLVATFNLQPPQIPYISNVTGTWITPAAAIDPEYWVQHLCQPVLFAAGINHLSARHNPVLLEVGPGQSLSSLAMQCLESDRVVLPSLRYAYEQQSDVGFLLNTLGQLWLSGVQIDWSGFYAEEKRDRLPLPTYPFERQRYWISPAKQTSVALNSESIAEETETTKTLESVFSPQSRSNLRNPYVAPTNEIESRIATLYQELLGIEQVGIYDNFFELGGHSLLGIQLISQLRKDFDVEMSLRPLFEAPTVSELALVIEEMLIAELEELPEDTVQQFVLVAPKSEQTLSANTQQRYKLPNNLEIAYQTKAEADYFYEDIFQNQVYVKHGITLGDRACIFDVGANIGMFTLFMAQHCQNPTIYAFEPAPPLFEILRLNTNLYEVNAKLFNFGVSNQTKTATFTFYPNSSGMSSFYADKEEEKEVLKAIMLNQLETGMTGMDKVMEHADELLEERFKEQHYNCQLKTLSDIISEQNVKSIDLLKIDVQKCEMEVIEGIQAQDWSKIRQIVIEVHDIEGRLEQITNLLKKQGYQVVAEQEDLYQGSNIYNVYAIRS
ncbi:FkbM family methyltransferase [Nostocaceae cyanobacterium CENA357]|uniref:Phenolphthiocerol/phthiocerol polyketide synthase subunit E n=1 Tax=Atlanticothrix silvestris CENA357 TaxID=1725252 RepID=A0A8J7L3Z2_9CYAN|nr:type I polyketide synthase [Atlanticothrix silvestris]MBH8554261.1 FkbM family methyltransferase [Atlanticothrix silvestris CENA357]